MKNTSLTLDLNTGRCQWGESAGQPFRLLVSGDICPIRNTATRMLAGESGAILADIAGMLADKDLSIVNLEAPMTERPAPILKIGPNLIVSPRSVELLRAGGWDIACCANNHIGDHGPAAAMQTLELLATNGIASVGAGRDLDAARKPLFITRGGRRVAVLAFAENEFGMATPTSAGANPLQPFKNISQIREASRQADLTVVLIHGGNEYLPVPAPRVIDTYAPSPRPEPARLSAAIPTARRGSSSGTGCPSSTASATCSSTWTRPTCPPAATPGGPDLACASPSARRVPWGWR